uniref:Caveolin n=1 Tax=Saccoglossus kowalevskii TaxID=10224 RepID=A0ABM0GVP5_SACKO|nr:PREDICTED: caveolin-3-like isoform X1 [Saccoglossus kowalevskii]
MDPESLDMVNRDPQELNPHVRAKYDDVFAEPRGTHSMDGVWRCAFRTFSGGKSCCYKVLTVICAVPTALICGFMFAFMSFEQIWCITPMLKNLRISMSPYKKCLTTVLSAFCAPGLEACGACCSKIRITLTHDGDSGGATHFTKVVPMTTVENDVIPPKEA